MENIRNISSKTEKETRLAFDKYRGVFWGVVRWIPSHFPVQRNFVWAGSGVIASELLGQQAQPPFSPWLSFRQKWFAPHNLFLIESQKERLSMAVMFPSFLVIPKTISPGATSVSSRWWTALVEGQLFNFSCWASGEKIAWRFLVKKYPMIKLPIWGDQSCKCMVNLRDFPFTVHCFGLVSYNDHSPWFPEFCWLEFSFGVEDWHK